MTITLPAPDTHCFDEDKTPPADVWSYSPGLVRQIIEADRAQRGEPRAWRAWFDKDSGARWLFSLWPDEENKGLEVDWQPLYTAPQPAHNEAEVQQLMLCVADWDVERSQYEALVRRILGVPQP